MSSFANIHNRDQLDARLDEPDILVGARVDRNIAALDEISDFIRRVASARQQMLYGAVPEVRHRCDEIMDESRQVFASCNGDIDGSPNVRAVRRPITHDSRRRAGDLIMPTHVPIALWRDGYDFHRQYCWGHSDSSLDAAYETVNRLPRPRAEHDLENSGGCDFTFIPRKYHRTVARLSSDGDLVGLNAPLSVWPIQRGDQVLMLKICGACDDALTDKYQIGKSEILHPWEQPVIG